MENTLEKFKKLPVIYLIIFVLAIFTVIILNLEFFGGLMLVVIVVSIFYLFFTKIIRSSKRKGLDIYAQKIKELLIDGDLSKADKLTLEEIKKEYKLTDKDVSKYNLIEFRSFFEKITNDSRITETERKELVKIYSDLNLPTDNLAYNQNDFNKYHTLYLIDKGELPIIKNHDLNVNLKPDEMLYFASKAFVLKNKLVSEKINYSGFSTSIRIAKGLTYRIGSMNTRPQKVNTIVTEDVGILYLTSANFGYLGLNKHFSIAYDKISSLDIRGGYLYLYKKGKETPFILAMEDYELLLAIVSVKINTPYTQTTRGALITTSIA